MTTARQMVLAGLALLAAGVAGVGCTHPTWNGDGALGQVTLGLTLSNGVTVNTVTYIVSGNGLPAVHGSIDVTSTTHATALVSGIPANTNPYTVSMHADSTDGNTHCDGSATVVIMSGATAMVDLTLQCRGLGAGTTGVVAINGRLDNCPFIKQYTVSALEAPVGGSISVGVNAVDIDTADTITYAWTTSPAGIGTFANDKTANTTFRCNVVGTTALAIAISDGVCGDNRSPAISLNCVTTTTGGGGASGAGGGAGTTGTAGASGGAGGAGGAGGGGLHNACLDTPAHEPLSGGSQCEGCTSGNCALTASGDSGCCALASAADQVLCEAVATCFQSPPAGSLINPCTTAGDGVNCFCGSSGAACFSTVGAANGPCTAPVIAAAKTSVPAQIQLLFNNTTSPLGRAVNLLNCRGQFCSAECSVN